MSAIKHETVKLSNKGELVIPRAIREALHWVPGMELTVVPSGQGVMIQPKRKKTGKRLEDLRGCIQYDGPPIPDDVLHAPVDYREDWEESEKHSR
jgi:AbrB family looped-hinge helix DNA binding protein